MEQKLLNFVLAIAELRGLLKELNDEELRDSFKNWTIAAKKLVAEYEVRS